MSLKSAQRLTLFFAALTVVLRIISDVWIRPLLVASFSSGHALLLVTLIGFLSLIVPLGAYALVLRPPWRSPRLWAVDAEKREFSANATPTAIGPLVVVFAYIASGAISGAIADFDTVAVSGFSLLLGIALLTPFIAILMTARPRLTLNRDGMTLHGLRRHSHYPWDGPFPRRPPGQWLNVDRGFLAFTLDRYRLHADTRDRIGTQAEMEDLQAAFAAIKDQPS
ncbi:hypothetical protein [Actinoplanes sp. NPDC051851]|uniref:hypothetical protein n=1 Tax=Actinoplanes sp. NPDC051851 TaxID=3154753 RepID=UPI003437535A